ncbi:hypothetical protein SFC43_25170 [Bacteroides sp. CR5/BHMF/2]|nr:hypothetical protein [Bacteroides sp. CR5/BHMF/2]
MVGRSLGVGGIAMQLPDTLIRLGCYRNKP